METYNYDLDAILLIELVGKRAVELYKEANSFINSLHNNHNKPEIRIHLYEAIGKIIERDIEEYFL